MNTELAKLVFDRRAAGLASKARHAQYRRMNDGRRLAGTVIGLIRRDRGHVYGGVLLDHEVDLRVRTGEDGFLSGTDVAKVLSDCFSIEIPILLHSVNPRRAPRVAYRFEEAGFRGTRIPFTALDENGFRQWLDEAREIRRDLKGGHAEG